VFARALHLHGAARRALHCHDSGCMPKVPVFAKQYLLLAVGSNNATMSDPISCCAVEVVETMVVGTINGEWLYAHAACGCMPATSMQSMLTCATS
jgi:hypothetical protein